MLPTSVPSTDSVTPEFEHLFRENFQFVYRTAYTVTGSRQDAEDVVQTIFLRLLRRNALSAAGQNPRGYLYRAAVNESLNVIRSRKRNELTANLNPVDAVCTNPDDSDERLQEAVAQAMTQLHPSAVEILILRYEHNHSDAEIARMLGKSRGTIAVTLYRARRRLKRLLTAATERRL
jgi:RNA polymerase sigma-70 factor (ECF subfamily)